MKGIQWNCSCYMQSSLPVLNKTPSFIIWVKQSGKKEKTNNYQNMNVLCFYFGDLLEESKHFWKKLLKIFKRQISKENK